MLACRNSERAEGDARQCDAIVQQLQAKTEQGGVRDELKYGARRYLKLTGATPEIDLKKVQGDARHDGKWVLRTTTSLPPEQVALAYRVRWRVENAFRTLKTPHELWLSTPVWSGSFPPVSRLTLLVGLHVRPSKFFALRPGALKAG